MGPPWRLGKGEWRTLYHHAEEFGCPAVEPKRLERPKLGPRTALVALVKAGACGTPEVRWIAWNNRCRPMP